MPQVISQFYVVKSTKLYHKMYFTVNYIPLQSTTPATSHYSLQCNTWSDPFRNKNQTMLSLGSQTLQWQPNSVLVWTKIIMAYKAPLIQFCDFSAFILYSFPLHLWISEHLGLLTGILTSLHMPPGFWNDSPFCQKHYCPGHNPSLPHLGLYSYYFLNNEFFFDHPFKIVNHFFPLPQ